MARTHQANDGQQISDAIHNRARPAVERRLERAADQQWADPERPATKAHARADDQMPEFVNGNHQVKRGDDRQRHMMADARVGFRGQEVAT